MHSAALFVWKSFCVCWVVRANPRERCLLHAVQHCVVVPLPPPITKARLHSKRPSTSPCSAPRSFGIGWTPSCSTKERARCFQPASAACLGRGQSAKFRTAPHSTIPKQFVIVNFDSGEWRVQSSFCPLIKDELVEDGEGPTLSMSHCRW